VAVGARAPEVNEEHGLAGDCGHIDESTEREREPGLQIKAIEGVEDVQIVTVRGVGVTVGER
jgi:hypothetical protein